MHLLKLELKRAFFSTKFLLLLIVIGALLVVPVIDNMRLGFAPATRLLDFGYRGILMIIVPLLAALPFAGTYAEERRSGYLPFILYRVKNSRYLWAKFAANAVSSAALIFLPMAAFFTLLLIFHEQGYATSGEVHNTYNVFSELQLNQPTLYGYFLAFQSGLFMMTYATMGMAASTIVRRPIFAYATPFILYLILTLFTDILSIGGWSPGVTWKPTSHTNATLLSVYGQMIVFLGASLFIIRRNFGRTDHL